MSNPLTRQTVLLIAWPIILSNVSNPLLGLVDTAVIGNLGDASLIGAIAIGGMIFSFLFWGFGFLRMGTTGLIAQAAGARDEAEIRAIMYRAIGVGLVVGLALLTLKTPIIHYSLALIDGSEAVESAAATYFRIRIWSAPFTMVNLVILGFFLGQQRSTHVLLLQVLLNATNIMLDVLFVIGFGLGVEGVALATVIAEVLVTAVGVLLVYRHMVQQGISMQPPLDRLRDITAMKQNLVVSGDIMIRTLCLIFAFAWFTNQGAAAGDVLLASNAILMQFVSFSAFFLDGYALAAESLVGQAVGAKDHQRLRKTLRYSIELGLATSILLSIAFLVTGPLVIDLLTNVGAVRASARDYLAWAIAAPVVSLWCYLLDGIFIGATCTREMRNAMIVSLALYLASWYLLLDFGNHGLWAALFAYFVFRALSLGIYLPNVSKKTRSATSS